VNVEKHDDARVAERRSVVASVTLVQAEWVSRPRAASQKRQETALKNGPFCT
jgi:hypothetical protein